MRFFESGKGGKGSEKEQMVKRKKHLIGDEGLLK